MKENLKSSSKYTSKILEIYISIGASVIGFIAVIVMATVILRYFFSITFIWVEEFVTFAFIFTTFWGVGANVLKNEHITIDYLFNKLTGKSKMIMSIINDVVIIFVCYIVLLNSFKWISAVGNQISDGLRVNMLYVYIIMPISMIMTIACVIIKIIKDINENNGIIKK